MDRLRSLGYIGVRRERRQVRLNRRSDSVLQRMRMPPFGSTWEARDCSGRRRNGSGIRGAALERIARPRPPSGYRRLPSAENYNSAAKSRGLVHVHHRPRSHRSRYLRFCSPRSQNHAAILVDGPHSGAAVQASAWLLRSSVVSGARGDLAQRPGLLANLRRQAHSSNCSAHAHQLSARGSGRGSGRDGHARYARDPRHIHLFHRRSGRAGARRSRRPHRQSAGREWTIYFALRGPSQFPAQGFAIRRDRLGLRRGFGAQ